MLSRLICIWAVLCCGVSGAVADEAPAWLRQATAANLPEYDKKVSYVVLQDESRITVDAAGLVTRAGTFAIKILRKEGRVNATAQEIYKTDTDKIREFRAWLIQSNGEVKKYEKNETIDAALVDNDVYNNVRKKVISASNDAAEGAVFGYETLVEERSVFGQLEWFFQPHEPVLASRLTVVLPAGWTVEARMFNHPEIQPLISGNSYTWELRNLPYIEPEPASPSIMNIVPRLVVSFFPPAGVASELRAFRNWADVSSWLASLNDPQVMLNDAMIAKAKELIAGASSEFEKIAAIARFSQQINYVSIQTGIGRGGGYRPHPATEIFAKSYGDCKDKTNLMRALLKAVGISSYPVSIYSGNRYYVLEDWPSPQQFNHCIIAVKVSDSIQAPAVVRYGKLGSLLIFDPTDLYARLGDIPGHEQGSLALIVAGDAGGIVRMPESAPESNRTERSLNLELLADGSIQTRIREEMSGDSAVMGRAQFRELTKDAYDKMIEAWVSGSVRGAKVSVIDFKADEVSGRSTLDVDFAAARYGQLMQGRLLVINPTIVSRRNSVELTEPTRKLPVVIESGAFEEKLQLKLPAGFVVDEMPEPIDLKTAFGTYRAECISKEGSLLYRRSLVLQNAVLPSGQYEEIRKFFVSIRDFEQSPVVLLKK
jgi:hypothetical protein